MTLNTSGGKFFSKRDALSALETLSYSSSPSFGLSGTARHDYLDCNLVIVGYILILDNMHVKDCKKFHKMMLESYVLFLFLILYDMNVIGWTRHRVQSLEIPKDVVA